MGQILARVDETRHNFEQTLEHTLGIVELSAPAQKNGDVVHRVEAVRIKNDRLAELLLGFVKALKVQQRIAEVVVKHGLARKNFYGAADRFMGLLEASGSGLQHAIHMQGIGVGGFEFQRPLVVATRFRHITVAVSFHRLLKMAATFGEFGGGGFGLS